MRYTKEQDITITDGVDFTSDMLHLAPDAPRREYYSRKKEGEIKTSVHWGQRKLLMSEIAFLVYFWDPKEVPHPIVVYAGAACGDHIPLLPDLFPQIKEFHLYDPEPFSIDPTDKLRLYSQLFTVDTAKEWSGRDDVLFISDIRTGDYTKMTSSDNEKAIIEDMELQKRCVEIIQPVQIVYLHILFVKIRIWQPKFKVGLYGLDDFHASFLQFHIFYDCLFIV